jgi:hypothetical protein
MIKKVGGVEAPLTLHNDAGFFTLFRMKGVILKMKLWKMVFPEYQPECRLPGKARGKSRQHS